MQESGVQWSKGFSDPLLRWAGGGGDSTDFCSSLREDERCVPADHPFGEPSRAKG